MKFELDESQQEMFNSWKVGLPAPPNTAVDGYFTFSFTPTNLGLITKVQYYRGAELDLTPYSDW